MHFAIWVRLHVNISHPFQPLSLQRNSLIKVQYHPSRSRVRREQGRVDFRVRRAIPVLDQLPSRREISLIRVLISSQPLQQQLELSGGRRTSQCAAEGVDEPIGVARAS